MPGIHPFDIAVIVLYLVGITALGIWTARRVKNLSDFFMPRRFGKGMMIMHAFGTGTASDQAVTVAAATFKGGLSGIWYQWLWLFVTPFYTLSRTPVAPGEQLVEPCVLPPSTAAAERTMLVTFGGLEIPLPSRASLIGFVVVWICVALMIGGFVGMVSWS